MTLDDNILDQPREAKVMNQITSNQAVRAFVTVVLVVVLAWQVVNGQDVNEVLLAVFTAMLGYYFGEIVPVPKERK